MDQGVRGIYEFGPFRLNAQRRVLVKAGEKVELTPKALDTLVVLVENSGRVVTKEELLEKVWPDVSIEENNLTQCISSLRKALGESAKENKYIATVPGEGYRFVAYVRKLSEDFPVNGERAVPTKLRPLWIPLVAGLLIVGVTFLFRWVPNRCPAARDPEYPKALVKLATMDYLSALSMLQKIGNDEPDNPRVHSALSEAWGGLGYDGNAVQEAKRALDLSRGCPTKERRQLEAGYAEAAGDSQRAIDLYGRLWNDSKDNLDYGTGLANAYLEAGKAQEAFHVLDDLRNVAASANFDPRLDLLEADIALSISDLEKGRDAAARAVKKATNLRDSPLAPLEAEAGLRLGWAQTGLGEPDKAREALEAAEQAFAQAGNQGGLADALAALADLQFGGGDLAGAKRDYQEALNICRKTQYERCTSELLCSMGDVLEAAGDLTEAERLYRQSEESSTRSADRSGIATSRLSLAKLLIDQANFTDAEQLARTTLQAFRDQTSETNALSLLTVLARSLLAQGKAAEAGEVVKQAEAASRSVKDRCSSLSLSIVEACLRAGSGAPKDIDESVKALADLSNLAGKASCFPVSLDARLAQGEIEAHSGPKPAGRTHLAALETESKKKGFQLIASQASKALLSGDKRLDSN